VGYVEGLVSVIGHADRAGPLRDYCVGLMLPCERKSVEPALGRGSATILRPAWKQNNCQVAVSLSVANHHASLPVAYRLYLPQD
jgi:SRSO17 transposase